MFFGLFMMAGGSPSGLWLIGQVVDDATTSPFLQLGAFAAAAAALIMWQRDTARTRDRLQSAQEQSGPLLVEIRDAFRANTDALRASAEASKAISDSLSRIPTEAEVTRLRDALAASERAHEREQGR